MIYALGLLLFAKILDVCLVVRLNKTCWHFDYPPQGKISAKAPTNLRKLQITCS